MSTGAVEAATGMLELNNDMIASGIILILTFIGIFTEEIHKIHRTKVAMAGAAVMVLVGQFMGFYSPDGALKAIDWNVVLLLGAMMTIIAIMIPTGGFQAIAYWVAKVSKGRLFFLLVLLGTAVTGLSLLLDNVTTVIIFGPLIVLICQALGVRPIPYLLAAALLSNTGGVATLVGDPPNLMIGSAAGIDFNTFFMTMGGIVAAAWVTTLICLKLLFKKELSVTPNKVEFEGEGMIKDKKMWFSSLLVLGIMVVLFVMHGALHWDAWVVSVLGLSALLLVTKHGSPDKYLAEAELSLLLFFVALFAIVGGVEHSQFLQYVGQSILPLVQADMLMACIILMWAAAIMSALIDNIPFTAAMIPIILGLEAQGIAVAPLWWCLSMGVGLGGNGSHLGSTANVFIVTLTERLAKRERDPSLAITPGMWIKKGTPVMFSTLVVATIVFYMFFDFFAKPIPKANAAMATEISVPLAH